MAKKHFVFGHYHAESIRPCCQLATTTAHVLTQLSSELTTVCTVMLLLVVDNVSMLALSSKLGVIDASKHHSVLFICRFAMCV